MLTKETKQRTKRSQMLIININISSAALLIASVVWSDPTSAVAAEKHRYAQVALKLVPTARVQAVRLKVTSIKA